MDFKKLEKAGKILDDVLLEAKKIVHSKTYIEMAEILEEFIRKKGGEPAFPCNLSTDNQAAHYTPSPDDKREVYGLLKIDCGVHINGWIADAAFTVDLTGENGKLVEAAEEALQAALSVIRDGIEVREIGRAVQAVASRYGLRPVENLGGHSMKRYVLHAGLFIPNVPRGSGKIREGMLIAVEPFISSGRGRVVDSSPVEIFSLTGKRSRSPRAEAIRKELQDEFKTLPFARRWVIKKLGKGALQWLRFLQVEGSLQAYPTLVDPGGLVAQAEATVVVEKDGVRVIAGGRDI